MILSREGIINMIRLSSIELVDFKNVEQGTVALSEWEPGGGRLPADIVGIYGQNGSGKTSIIKALSIFKSVLLGYPVNVEAQDCPSRKTGTCSIGVKGYCFAEQQTPIWSFSLLIKLAEGHKGDLRIVGEKLSCKDLRPEAGGRPMRAVFDYSASLEGDSSFSLLPMAAWRSVSSISDRLRTDIAVAQRVSFSSSRSLLFSPEFSAALDLAENIRGDSKAKLPNSAVAALDGPVAATKEIVRCLRYFALKDLAVVSASQQAEAMIDHLSISTHQGDLGELADASFRVDISKPARVSDDHIESLNRTLETIGMVLNSLVPGLQLGMMDLGKLMMDDGAVVHQIEITCTRGDVTVPLRCESEGIKKLVTVLTMLVDVYSKPGSCVAIDEIDSGIFEFLLGELLQVLSEHGRGQLIFTAHNLRPLETVGKARLVFTTTNPRRRYIKFRGTHATNNLRNQYLRAINLGGQAETIYEPTSKFAIDGAFHDASSQVAKGA